MHGLGAGLNGTFTAGASVSVMPRFDVQQIAEALTRQPATLFFGVPTMYARLAEQRQLPALGALRLIVSGSAPLDPALFNRITAEAGQSPLERYGMSETVMLTSNPLNGERKAGSVGTALPGVEVRLGADQGVEVRGPNVFTGYWNLPGVASFTDDGWFRTGDIGRFDEDGYLYLVGRASDLIITGGYNVYPREVEDAIRELPGIDDVAVVGLPDDTWGELVVAFYVSSRPEGVDSDEAMTALGSSLAAYKRPRRWIQMNELPRNAMGKVRRDVLREQG
jgi:malonyl-CoA/methylmalonyl-CoA synthetase